MHHLKIFFPLAVILLGVSCQKLDQGPTDRYTDLNYWTTPDHANALLNTAYAQLFQSNHFFYNEGLSDNAYVGRGDQDNAFTIGSGSFNASLARFDQDWTSGYGTIKSCN